MTRETSAVHGRVRMWIPLIIGVVMLAGAACLVHLRGRESRTTERPPSGKASESRQPRPNDGIKEATPSFADSAQDKKETEEHALHPRILLEQAKDWRDRVRIIEEIRMEDLPAFQDFLFEVAEGSDVDAVRVASIKRLGQLGGDLTWNASIVQRFCARLAIERVVAVRCHIMQEIGSQHLKDPEENDLGLETLTVALTSDSDPEARACAATIVSLFDCEQALAALNAALVRETDTKVQEEIKRAIRHLVDQRPR